MELGPASPVMSVAMANHLAYGLAYAAQGTYQKALPELLKYSDSYAGRPRSISYLG